MALKDYATAVVTGASSGLGEAVARALRERDIAVFAVARRGERLEKLADETGCTPVVLDLRDTDAIHAGLAGIDADIVVNNAGLGIGQETLDKVDMVEMDTMIDINFRAVLHVLNTLLPGMVERDRGHVINIGSVGGVYPNKVGAGYGATKAAIHKMCQDLRFDLAGTRIRVTEIIPGLIRSEFFDVRFAGDEERIAKQFARENGNLEPEDVAETILFALDAPWHVSINLIEVLPLMQVMGGARFYPFKDD